MRKEVKIETLFQEGKEKYLTIIYFTMQFADKIEWFREYHFRYALEKNPNLSPPYQKTLSNEFDKELKEAYTKPYSPIKKCFTSRSNLVDYLKNLVKLELLEKKTIDGKNHYRFARGNVRELFYAYDCAWFIALTKKIPQQLLNKMKEYLEKEYRDELKKHDAFFIRYRI